MAHEAQRCILLLFATGMLLALYIYVSDFVATSAYE